MPMKYKLSYSGDRKRAFYHGATFVLMEGGYYRCRERNGARGYLLHRFIYETEKQKEIPDGYVIHHKDFDKSNNDISNLECVLSSVHTDIHNNAEKVNKCVTAMKDANKRLNYPGCRASHEVQKLNNYPTLRRSNEKRKKPLLMYSLQSQFLNRFDSLLDAAAYIGKPPAHISQCANMKRKTAFGFIWRWESESPYTP